MYVSGLVRNGPAHACGLIRRNDVLLEVNGARVGEGEELANDRDVKARMMELCAAGGTSRRRVRLQRRLRLRSVMAAGASSGGDPASPSTGSEDQPGTAASAEVAMSAVDAHAGASRNAGGHRRGKPKLVAPRGLHSSEMTRMARIPACSATTRMVSTQAR